MIKMIVWILYYELPETQSTAG